MPELLKFYWHTFFKGGLFLTHFSRPCWCSSSTRLDQVRSRHTQAIAERGLGGEQRVIKQKAKTSTRPSSNRYCKLPTMICFNRASSINGLHSRQVAVKKFAGSFAIRMGWSYARLSIQPLTDALPMGGWEAFSRVGEEHQHGQAKGKERRINRRRDQLRHWSRPCTAPNIQFES